MTRKAPIGPCRGHLKRSGRSVELVPSPLKQNERKAPQPARDGGASARRRSQGKSLIAPCAPGAPKIAP